MNNPILIPVILVVSCIILVFPRSAALMLVVAILVLGPKLCHGQTVGLHLGSHHFPNEDFQNNANLGLYVRFGNGLVVGGYRNTLRRNSFYAGYQQDWGPVGLTVGGITGYQHRKDVVPCTAAQVREVTVGRDDPVDVRCYSESGASKTFIAPMISPSVRLPAVLGITPRLSYVPGVFGASNVIHLSLERSF